MKDLDALRKIAEQATPGPWHWSGNADNRQLYLATWIKGAGRCQVMDFERWGMQKAVPRFLDDESLMMQTAKSLLVYEVARNQNLPDDTPRSHPQVYRADVVDVRHPNAKFMAAANPETILALITRTEQAEASVLAATQPVVNSVEELVTTRAGLALANSAFNEGLSAGIKACNESLEGEPFVKPVSPYRPEVNTNGR